MSGAAEKLRALEPIHITVNGLHEYTLYDVPLPLIADCVAALEVYADARNWGVLRDDKAGVQMGWIGPTATDPVPGVVNIARAPLTALQDHLNGPTDPVGQETC